MSALVWCRLFVDCLRTESRGGQIRTENKNSPAFPGQVSAVGEYLHSTTDHVLRLRYEGVAIHYSEGQLLLGTR